MSKYPNMARISEVVRRHHGGLEAADDVQLKRVWDALPVSVQAAYLDDLAGETKSKKPEPAAKSADTKEVKTNALSPESK